MFHNDKESKSIKVNKNIMIFFIRPYMPSYKSLAQIKVFSYIYINHIFPIKISYIYIYTHTKFKPRAST